MRNRPLDYLSAVRCAPESVQSSSPFRLDLERVLYSSYFRRLQGKTQVWNVQESDFVRTRLTHSLETAQIGRQIAEALEIDSYLVEALCLAHDLGHPPFAHEGARLLDLFARQHSDGAVRFDDNAQNLRIIIRLSPGITQEGLNPTASMIDGLIKYKRICSNSSGWYPEEDAIVAWAGECCKTGARRNPLASLVEIADDLAYACHDIEDGIRADMIRCEDLEQLIETLTGSSAHSIALRTLEPVLKTVRSSRSPYALRQERHRLHHELLHTMLDEVLSISRSCSFRTLFDDPSEHETLNPYLKELPDLADLIQSLKGLVLERVIHAPNVQTLRFASLSLLQSYLERFWPVLNNPLDPIYKHALMSLPRKWQHALASSEGTQARLRLLLDYVAGMSDTYLMHQATMFFNPLPYRAVENRK